MAITPFQNIPIKECGEPLIQLKEDHFLLEPAYFNMGFCNTPDLYIREGIFEKLLRIEAGMAGNYRFLIYDPWRSREVQQTIFEYYNQKIRDENKGKGEEELRNLVGTFVSHADDMSKIPPHSTGGAIDLTLIDSNGEALDMGSPFDDTTEKARTDIYKNNAQFSKYQSNRQRLLDVMADEGFINYPDEWWHFDYGTQLGVYDSGTDGVAIYGEVSSDFKLLQTPNHDRAFEIR